MVLLLIIMVIIIFIINYLPIIDYKNNYSFKKLNVE